MAENIVVEPRRIGMEKPLLPAFGLPALVVLPLLAVEERRLAIETGLAADAAPVAAVSRAFTVAEISFFSFDTY